MEFVHKVSVSIFFRDEAKEVEKIEMDEFWRYVYVPEDGPVDLVQKVFHQQAHC